MDAYSTVPESAQPILKQIDAALKHLAHDRMPHFDDAFEKYQNGRKQEKLAFERLVVCELYCALKDALGDIVFAEFPVPGVGKLDLWLDDPDHPTYIELKMYYSMGRDDIKSYKHDFNKLKRTVDGKPGAVATQIHFHFYPDRPHIAHATLRERQEELEEPREEYWSNYRIIPAQEPRQHFVRLAFGRN